MTIDDVIMTNEVPLRLGFFFGVLAIMAVWELMSPRRHLQTSKPVRWSNNIGLVVLNSFVSRLLFPAAAAGVAVFTDNAGWGLFNILGAPFWLATTASLLLLDFAVWLQHLTFHAVPVFWRLHRVHHADMDIDVTTGVRFHTLEIVLSMLIKFAVILLLGPPVVAVVVFEVILNATSMFNHANVHLPLAADRILRRVVVTPDMHRVHHSIEGDETNSNFGFNLPWWDRLFGTYRAQPRAGHQGMTIGLSTFRDARWSAWLPGMLAIPFRRDAREFAGVRRRGSAGDD